MGRKESDILRKLADQLEAESGKEENEEEAHEVDEKTMAVADRIGEKLAEALGGKRETSDPDPKERVSKVLAPHGEVEVRYPSDLESLEKEEKITTFFKALLLSKADPTSQEVLKALVEGTDAQGGYLVPEELQAEVFRLLPDMAVMRRIARIIPMNTDTLLLNNLDARPSAYWTSEYAQKTTTSAEFSQVTLSPNDLVCLLPVTEQLVADANIDVVNFVVSLFVEAIAQEEDRAFFRGSGTGQPRGIDQETLTQVDAGGAGDFDDIISLIHSVPQVVRRSPNAAFVANRHTIEGMRKVKDSNGNYIWRDGGTAPGGGTETRRPSDTLYGYPVYEQNDIANGQIFFGDWRYYIIGDRQRISVRTTTEGGDAWRRNAIEIKAVERVDGRAVRTDSFAEVVNFN